MADNTVLRMTHDLTQAAWFGGALMGAVGIDAAARTVVDDHGATRIADAAWTSWHPVANVALAAHLAAGLGLTFANKGRIASQRGAATLTAVKTAVTAAALGAEVYTRRLGRAVSEDAELSADEQQQDKRARSLRRAQWALVGLTGVLIATGARMGEQQRPSQLMSGVTERLGLKH